MKIILKEIGMRIKDIRAELRLSQQGFADNVGVKTKVNVSHWEKGRSLPSYEQLYNIAFLGNVKIDWIISGEGIKYESIILKELRERIIELEGKLSEQDLFINKSIKVLKAAEELVNFKANDEDDSDIKTINLASENSVDYKDKRKSKKT